MFLKFLKKMKIFSLKFLKKKKNDFFFLEKSVSNQKKAGRGPARPSFFWYDNQGLRPLGTFSRNTADLMCVRESMLCSTRMMITLHFKRSGHSGSNGFQGCMRTSCGLKNTHVVCSQIMQALLWYWPTVLLIILNIFTTKDCYTLGFFLISQQLWANRAVACIFIFWWT